MNAIEITGLHKKFPEFELGPLNLSIPRGSIVGFIGPNGAGKTTTIKLMIGLLIPDGGDITLLGETGEWSNQLKNRLGIVLGETRFHDYLRFKDINSVLRLMFDDWDEDRFFQLKDLFKLPDKTPIKKYSGGMKQKLALAIALSHRAELLILDEPLSGLDPIVRDEVLDLLRDFLQSDRHTVFLSSHLLSDLDKICDYIAYLDKGKLVFMASREELADQFGFLMVERDRASDIPAGAIVGRRDHHFGSEMLVRRDQLDPAWPIEPASIEQIMLFFHRGGNQ